MEQRLIDANALKVSYCKQCLKETRNEQIEVKQTPYCAVACPDFDVIDKQPTVDAVPVVASDRNKLCPINHGLRCKDIDNCAFWCEWGQCAVKAIAVACADGERKEQEND